MIKCVSGLSIADPDHKPATQFGFGENLYAEMMVIGNLLDQVEEQDMEQFSQDQRIGEEIRIL